MSNIPKQHSYTSDCYAQYLVENKNLICRLCLGLEKHPLKPIFNATDTEQYSKKIMAIASVTVSEDDVLPQNICHKCIAHLNIAFKFKTNLEQVQTKFIAALARVQELQQKESNESNNTTVMLVPPTFLQPISIKPVDNCDNNIKINENTIELEFDEQYVDLNTNDIIGIDAIENTNKAINTSEDLTGKPKFKYSCYSCQREFRTNQNLQNHLRTHTGERPYKCHLCERRFKNGGHLYTHMRTHTGEKKHLCAQCPKAFATLQQLTKHIIAIHTNEKPYCCEYCSKCFANSSNLNTHTKIHKGEKNYLCHQCEKAFCTKGQLDQHTLVHTGEKRFMCEFCEKRFSQKGHLVRHMKMHKSKLTLETTEGAEMMKNDTALTETIDAKYFKV